MNGGKMDNGRWREIERIFDAALEVDDARRAAFLAGACAGDETLRREVESLLDAHNKAGGFLNSPAANMTAEKPAGTTRLMRPEQARGLPSATAVAESAQRIGSYQLIREIAQGGMGSVWLAERADDQFHQQVAIKLLKAEAASEELLSRFRHERQVLAGLNHPQIARLLDGGATEDGRPYFVMEYIEGEPLDEYCARRQLSLNERLQLFRQVCAAVHYAHQNLVIHRDLKPGNILVAAEGEPKLLDFGIAKVLQPDLAQSYSTLTGLHPMTPAYASPEQTRGEKLTTASDVYSLGVVLYELLTGHTPYQLKDNTFGELVKAICEQEPIKPSIAVTQSHPSHDEAQTPSIRNPQSAPRNLKGDVDSIVLMALRKEPSARYSSVEQFSEDIRRYLEGLPTIARKGTFSYRAVKYLRRNRIPVAAAALVLLTLIGGIFATWRQVVIARASQVRAENALTTAEDRKQQAEAARNEADQQRADAVAQRTTAEEQRQLAVEQKVLADEQRIRAEQEEQTKRQFLYAAQMKLAHQAWDPTNSERTYNIERMQELLDAQLPQPGQQDLRGFEWYYLWRLAHSEIVSLKHTAKVTSIVLTPDGTKMASQTLSGDIRIWVTATGKELAPIHDPEANASCLAISPDGKFFAQGKNNGQIKIYAVSNGAHLSTLECGQKEIRAIVFSPDGKLLVAATFDGTASVWAVPTWEQQVVFKASRSINTIAFTPDSKQFLTGGFEGLVKVWHPLSGKELRAMPSGRSVYALAFIPDSNNVVSSHTDSTLKIWDFATGQQVAEMKTTYATGGLICSPDGRMIASGHQDPIIRLWSARGGTLLTEIKTHGGPISALAFTPDGKGLFTGSADRTLKFRNVQEVSEARLIAQNTARLDSVAFTRDGRRLITGDEDQIVRMYDLSTGRELQKLEGHQQLTMALGDELKMIKVAVSPVGGYFATSGYDGTVRTWDEKTGRPLQVFRGHTSALYAIAISPDGRFIASGGNDLAIKIWDAVSGQELHTLRGHTKRIGGAAFSPRGKILVTCGQDGTIRIWDYLKGIELSSVRPYTATIRSLAFSPDGKLLALGGDDRYIVLLDTTTWRTVKTLKGHAQFVTRLKFSPDGKRLASSSRDSTTRIWELEQGQEVLTLRGHGDNINMDLSFSPDGASLATVAYDRKLLLWPAATPREVLARSKAGIRPLRATVSADAGH